MIKKKMEKVAVDILGNNGRLIGSSKTIYRHEHPADLIVFNGNICTIEDGKIWYGDLNLTEDEGKIRDLAKTLGRYVYVLYESSARFEKDENPDFDNYVYLTNGEDFKIKASDIFSHVNGSLKYSPDMKSHNISKVLHFNDIDLFKCAKKSKISPVEKMYQYVMEQTGVKPGDGEGFNVQLVYITEKDYSWLEYLMMEWAKKNHPYIHPAKLEQSVSWTLFDIGPGVFRNTEKCPIPFWVESGSLYIKEGDLIIKK